MYRAAIEEDVGVILDMHLELMKKYSYYKPSCGEQKTQENWSIKIDFKKNH